MSSYVREMIDCSKNAEDPPETTTVDAFEYKVDMVIAEVFEYMINVASRNLGKMESRTRYMDRELKSYKFIPFHSRRAVRQILKAVEVVKEKNNKKQTDVYFLDAGCGIGNVVLLAKSCGILHSFGLELDEKTLDVANLLSKSFRGNEIIKGDIMEFKRYGMFDIVYYFRPMKDPRKQEEFEKIVEDGLKVGGVIIANWKYDQSIRDDKRFEPVYQDKSGKARDLWLEDLWLKNLWLKIKE